MGIFEEAVKYNFLYVGKYRVGRTWVYQESEIPYSMLRLVTEGSAEFYINEKKYLINAGEIAYIPEGSLLYCEAMEDNFTFISIRFTTSVFYEGADFLTESYGLSKIMESNEELINYFIQIFEISKSNSNTKALKTHGYLELLIASIIDKTNSENPNFEKNIHDYDNNVFSLEEIRRRAHTQDVKDDPRIQVVIDYIVLHPTENYTGKYLSQISGLAETTFRRLFKKQTGKSPNGFIKELRLITAARLLLQTDDLVNDIAYEVGYEDTNYFIRLFKNAFGMTPRKFRLSAREY